MRYGKNQKEVRHSVQDPGGRDHRQWSRRDRRALPGAAAYTHGRGALGAKVSGGHAHGCSQPGEGARAPGRETAGQGGRAHHADGYFKKSRQLETTAEKRRFVDHQRTELGSTEAACRAIGLATSSYYYKAKTPPLEKARRETEIRDLIEKVQAEFPQYGVRRVHEHLERRLGGWEAAAPGS